MDRIEKMADKLISEFTGNYMEKLFYFCLRKTSNIYEAEDLAQDITLNIIYSLRNGQIPESFSAWVWKIAHNRYCVWATKKHVSLERIKHENVRDEDARDEEMSAEEEYILNEDMASLRRELAFIAKEYREIVVAYYIEDRKLKDIATSLDLPEGTVKSKLFYARKKLKEGMNMAREFGKRSYKPEEVGFSASGAQPSGLPWKAVQRKIPKNILLEASNNPSTLEELSIELGIALPYIEEEVDILCRSTLLKKVGDKYITNFFIQSRECQREMYFAKKKNIKRLTELADNISICSLGKIKALGVVKNDMSDDELKWWVFIFLIDHCVKSLKGFDGSFPVKRGDKNETWGFTGYEIADIPEITVMGHNGVCWKNVALWHYKIAVADMWNAIPESHDYRDALLLCEAVTKGKNVSELVEDEKNTWKRIENKFAHADGKGNIIPDVVVLSNGNEKRIRKLFEAHSDYNELRGICQATFDSIFSILKAQSNSILHTQLAYNASIDISSLRILAVNEAISNGDLIIPKRPEKTTLGVALHIYN